MHDFIYFRNNLYDSSVPSTAMCPYYCNQCGNKDEISESTGNKAVNKGLPLLSHWEMKSSWLLKSYVHF